MVDIDNAGEGSINAGLATVETGNAGEGGMTLGLGEDMVLSAIGVFAEFAGSSTGEPPSEAVQ
jgi:hypothetical protein